MVCEKNNLYDSPPLYDEYNDDEWYLSVIGDDQNLPSDEPGYKSRNVGGVVAVEENNGVVVNVRLETPLVPAKIVECLTSTQDKEGLNILDYIMGSHSKFKLQNKEGNEFSKDGDILYANNHNSSRGESLIQKNPKVTPTQINIEFEFDYASDALADNFKSIYVGPNYNSFDPGGTCLEPGNTNHEVKLEQVHLTMKKKRFSGPFDPGGTSQEPSKTTCEIELCGWVMVLIYMERVDVPFDPGGFGPATRLEDESFFKTGRMM